MLNFQLLISQLFYDFHVFKFGQNDVNYIEIETNYKLYTSALSLCITFKKSRKIMNIV